jgi:hypothetical protein
MRHILTVSLILACNYAFAGTIKCEGWYQEPGASIERAAMTVASESSTSTVYASSYKGYDFRAEWNRPLTTFYVTIEHSGNRILFTTARVPTPDHPENFTDLNLPSGPRLAVNCEEK